MRTNRTGKSRVSAITHTPASGPFGPVTTPPMSSASIATSAAGCWAYERVKKESELRAATKATAAARVSTRLLVMGRSSDVAEGADATTARFGAAGSSPVHRFQAMLPPPTVDYGVK